MNTRYNPLARYSYNDQLTSEEKELIIQHMNNEDIDYDIDIIKSVVLDAKERCPNVELAEIYYLSEGKYSFVELLDDEFTGVILENYLYKDETYIDEDIVLPCSPDSIIYYKK